MSVLVKSMKLPKSCQDCPLNYDQIACKVTGTGWWSDTMVLMDFDSDKERLYDCPLIEIPTPHGRLGDLDALWDKMSNYSDNEGAKMPFGDNDFMIHRDSACELIEDASTVIEAEVGDGMSEELKPCPFCGGTNIHMYSFKSSDLHGFTHLCMINGDGMVKVESRLFATEEEAIKAWNRRVTE